VNIILLQFLNFVPQDFPFDMILVLLSGEEKVPNQQEERYQNDSHGNTYDKIIQNATRDSRPALD
jgi:hypothetical protein